MITQNRIPTNPGSSPTTYRTAETSLTGRFAAAGGYTDVDTLSRRKSDVVRPGSFADVDTLARPKSDVVRPGSYVDMMLP